MSFPGRTFDWFFPPHAPSFDRGSTDCATRQNFGYFTAQTAADTSLGMTGTSAGRLVLLVPRDFSFVEGRDYRRLGPSQVDPGVQLVEACFVVNLAEPSTGRCQYNKTRLKAARPSFDCGQRSGSSDCLHLRRLCESFGHFGAAAMITLQSILPRHPLSNFKCFLLLSLGPTSSFLSGFARHTGLQKSTLAR